MKTKTIEEILNLVKKRQKKIENKEVFLEIDVIFQDLFWVFVRKKDTIPYFALAFSSDHQKNKNVIVRFYQHKIEKDILNKKTFKNFSTLKEGEDNPYKNEWVIICKDGDVYENGLKVISYLLRFGIMRKIKK
jgi:hypothetical protein